MLRLALAQTLQEAGAVRRSRLRVVALKNLRFCGLGKGSGRMTRLALAASAVAEIQRNESGWTGAVRRSSGVPRMQAPVPCWLAVCRFGRDKAIKIGRKARTIVL